jgi:hypothetical protein
MGKPELRGAYSGAPAERQDGGEMAEIEVTEAGDVFQVVVREGSSQTRHSVSASAAERQRLAPGRPPKQIIEAAFRFLLDREPKESILARFALSDIARYFPEFERGIADYLP